MAKASTKSRTGTKSGTDSGSGRQRALVRELLKRHGTTYAHDAGITLRDTPMPLYQLLVLSMLLSARIRADIAVASARALADAGMKNPRRMADATWQQRVDALGVGGYRRYDERTSTMLGEGAELVLERWGGDLRRLRRSDDPEGALREVPGIGPMGVSIFLREAQAVWPEYQPYLDGKALQGARKLGLPESAGKLADMVRKDELAPLAAGLVRAALSSKVADEVRQAAET
ncbi:hypothetical protein [Streptomyces diacarni]|uniref:hypothetical protein n=1 Tax=Streptomyces diacarni TaxID=2800381 RepID=UPI0015F0BF21|nr:hypothetical protein [Streptomyces diacarni]